MNPQKELLWGPLGIYIYTFTRVHMCSHAWVGAMLKDTLCACVAYPAFILAVKRNWVYISSEQLSRFSHGFEAALQH